MFINFYIVVPTYCFILMYTCGLKVVIKRICYVIPHLPGFLSSLYSVAHCLASARLKLRTYDAMQVRLLLLLLF